MEGNEIWIILSIAALVVVALIVWISMVASALTIAFTVFMMDLPIFISLLLFILFPPTLIVFLSGYAMIEFGVADKILGDKEKSKFTE